MPDNDPAPTGPFRVKDSVTGDEYTVAAIWAPDHQKILDKPAVDSSGRFLPQKSAVDLGSTSSRNKESK